MPIGAFLVLAASHIRIADAYPRPGGGWTLELHGAYPWQECRFSPEQWQAFYEVHLAGRYRETMLDGEKWLSLHPPPRQQSIPTGSWGACTRASSRRTAVCKRAGGWSA